MSKKTLLATRPELLAQFEKLLKGGTTITDACAQLEVPLSCFKEWRRWGSIVREDGKPAKEPFRTFALRVNAALASFENYLLDEIVRQGRDARYASDVPEVRDPEGNVVTPAHKKGDIILAPSGYVARPGAWAANKWLLEKRFPKKYQQPIRVIVEQDRRSVLSALERGLPPEWFARALEILSRLDDDSIGADDGGAGPAAPGAPAAGGGEEQTRH